MYGLNIGCEKLNRAAASPNILVCEHNHVEQWSMGTGHLEVDL